MSKTEILTAYQYLLSYGETVINGIIRQIHLMQERTVVDILSQVYMTVKLSPITSISMNPRTLLQVFTFNSLKVSDLVLSHLGEVP